MHETSYIQYVSSIEYSEYKKLKYHIFKMFLKLNVLENIEIDL